MRWRVTFFVHFGRVSIQKYWTEIFDGTHIVLCSSPARLRARHSPTRLARIVGQLHDHEASWECHLATAIGNCISHGYWHLAR